VIVIVCGWASFGRFHNDGPFGLRDGLLGLVTVLVGVLAPVTVLVGVVGAAAAAAAWVVVLRLVTNVEPHAQRETVANMSTASVATDVSKRGLDTLSSATRGPQT
jgi:hypothetical protein